MGLLRPGPRRPGLRPPTGFQSAAVALSLALLGVAVAALVQESRAEWRQWQSRFLERRQGRDTLAPGLQQIWLPDLDRVDRCTSCHVGIEHPAMGIEEQPFRSHSGSWLETHRPERYGCTACHGGQGEATTFHDAAHPGSDLPFWDEPMGSPELMEARCGACHQERQPPATEWLSGGRALMADRNCVACHAVRGHDPAEVRAPRLDGLGGKVSSAWLRGWLSDPRAYLERSRMGDFRLGADEVEALTAFLLAEDPDPTAPASPPGGDEEPLGPVDWAGASAERGGEVFRRSRCVTCHSVDGRGGTLAPELGSVGAKATREWLYWWIRDPHRLQPDTLMPRFRFTDAEVRDLAWYIAEDLAEPRGLSDDRTPPDPSLAPEGRRVFERRGCRACHALEGVPETPRIGPDLSGVGDLTVDRVPLVTLGLRPSRPNYLFTKVTSPEKVLAGARMPTFGFSEQEAAAVTVALLSLREQELPPGRITTDPQRVAYEPQGAFGDLVRRYRCLSCHQIQGTGGTLSTVELDRIGSQLRPEYLTSYLQNPIAVRVSLPVRMPRLNIARDEAQLLSRHLSTVMVDDALAADVPRDPATLARGRELFDSRGCVGCHIVGDAGGYVGPDLNGSGARLQPGWTVAFLVEPGRWKPGTLQPDYGLTRDEAQALAAYTLSLPGRGGGGGR